MNRSAPVFYGWYVVVATFVVLFGGFGAVYSFGAFVLPIGTEFAVGRAGIAGVFSSAVFILFLTGAFSGMLADRIGPRPVITIGVIAICCGLAGAAMAREFAHVLLCYGVGVGLGVGFVYVPAISAVQPWFDRRRGLASGIAVTGIGVGTLVMPIVAGQLLGFMSWREVFCVLAAVMLVLGAIAVLVIESDPAARGLAVDGGIAVSRDPSVPRVNEHLRPMLRSRPFILFYCASAILSVPVFIPFVHLVASAEDLGIARTQAVAILGLIGLGSTAGRFIVGGFADRLGRRRALIGMLGGIGVAYIAWLTATGVAMLSVFAFVFGVCYGAYVALSPALLADYFSGPKLSSVIGMQYTAAGLGSVLGPVFAGYLFDVTGRYTLALLVGIACSVVACALVACMPEPVRIR